MPIRNSENLLPRSLSCTVAAIAVCKAYNSSGKYKYYLHLDCSQAQISGLGCTIAKLKLCDRAGSSNILSTCAAITKSSLG
ncbi:hypothetical protein [Tumidithrix helvetica]|uniref:hypothetical protein n=1 Tax=Tumidithrix helvetica TaxID=3457545 RepID=UPI003CC67942